MNHLRFSYLIINLCLSVLFSQSIEVKGTIADYESQHPLVGVNIVVGEFGTTSDETGSFFLTINDGTEISFSFVIVVDNIEEETFDHNAFMILFSFK